MELIDEVIAVKSDAAIEAARELPKQGASSPEFPAEQPSSPPRNSAKRQEFKGKNIIAVFPDSGERYPLLAVRTVKTMDCRGRPRPSQ